MLNRVLDVFASFRSHDVKFVVIGGIAAVLHGVPRATFDLDILIEASQENAERLLEAMLAAGLGTAALITPEGVLANEITVFQDRVRIDVQTSTPGINFDDAFANAKRFEFQGQTFLVLSVQDLINAKLASGRPGDLEDVRVLKALLGEKSDDPKP